MRIRPTILPLLGLVLTLVSCGENQPAVRSNSDSSIAWLEPASSRQDSLVLESFSLHQQPLDLGCSELFSAGKQPLDTARLLLASDIMEAAVVKVAGRFISLKKDSAASQDQEGRYTSVYKGNGYTATLSVRRLRQMEEVGYYEGELVVTDGQRKTVVKVFGETGC